MRSVKLYLLTYVFVLSATAQNNIDSLRRIFNTSRQDTNYIKAAALLSERFRNTNPDSSIKYAEAAINTSTATNWNSKYLAQAYNSLGYSHYFKGNYPRSIAAFQEYYNVSARLNDKTNMAFAINNEGNVYIELGNYATALSKYQQALSIRKENNDTYGIAASYNNIGYIYKDIGDYEKALSNFFFALREFEKLKSEDAIAITHTYIAAVYWRKKDYAASTQSYEKALGIQQKLNNKNGMGISLQGIANNYGEQKKYAEAVQYYDQALALYRLVNDVRQIALVESNLGELHYRKGDFTNAHKHYKASVNLHQKINNKRSLGTALLGLAASSIQLNNLGDAKNYIDTAQSIIEANNSKEQKKNLYLVQSNYHTAANNYKTALEYYNRYADEKDSILNQENIKTLNNLQVQYETEKKQLRIDLLSKDNAIKELAIQNQKLEINKRLYEISQQNLLISQNKLLLASNELEMQKQSELILRQRLDSSQQSEKINLLNKENQINALELNNKKLEVNKKNILLLVTIAGTLLLMLLGYSYYRRYKLRKEKELQTELMKQRDLAAKAVLEAEEKERIRIASDLHDGVGQMMSAARMNLSAIESNLNFTSQEQKNAYDRVIALVDESCREVRAVSHNMMPNALLKAGLAKAVREFLDKIDGRIIKVNLYSEGLDKQIDTNVETVLYRVIQECVNNVMKHAKASYLDISLIKDNEGISATIEDNGNGFDTTDQSKFNGIGLKNVETRISYLKGTVEWSSQLGKGTLVAIHVPLNG